MPSTAIAWSVYELFKFLLYERKHHVVSMPVVTVKAGVEPATSAAAAALVEVGAKNRRAHACYSKIQILPICPLTQHKVIIVTQPVVCCSRVRGLHRFQDKIHPPLVSIYC